MSNEEIINTLMDILCENQTVAPSMVIFEQEKEALREAIKIIKAQKQEETK